MVLRSALLFKQLKFIDWALGSAAFAGAVAFLYAVDPDLMLDSPWVLVILPFGISYLLHYFDPAAPSSNLLSH